MSCVASNTEKSFFWNGLQFGFVGEVDGAIKSAAFIETPNDNIQPNKVIMTISTLKDLYIDQLQDLYSADKQSLESTRKMRDAATDSELKQALSNGVEGIQEGIDTLETIIKSHDADPNGEFCKGMEGLVKEARAHTLDADITDDDVRDASIITQYQRMTHYGLAGYGCLVAFAKRLDLHSDAAKLQVCLDNTYGGDREMTRIATGEINKAAAA